MAPKQMSKQPFLEGRKLSIDSLTADAPAGVAREWSDGDVLIDESIIKEVAPSAEDIVASIPHSGLTSAEARTTQAGFGALTSKIAGVFGPAEALQFCQDKHSGEALSANWELASRVMGGVATTGSLIFALALSFAAFTGHVYFFYIVGGAAADAVAAKRRVAVRARGKSIEELALVNRVDSKLTLPEAIALALRMLARIGTKCFARVHTLGVLAQPRGAAYDPALYDGLIYRIIALIGLTVDSAAKRSQLYRLLKMINGLSLIMAHFSAYNSRGIHRTEEGAGMKPDSDEFKKFATDAFGRAIQLRMYSAKMFVNLSHRENDAMLAIVADKDEIPRLSGGPAGWKGLISSVTEFNKLASIGVTVLNAALPSHHEGHKCCNAGCPSLPSQCVGPHLTRVWRNCRSFGR